MAILYVKDEFEKEVIDFIKEKMKEKEHLDACGKFYDRAAKFWNSNLEKIDQSIEELEGNERTQSALGWKKLKQEIIEWASLGNIIGEKSVDWTCNQYGLKDYHKKFFIECLQAMRLYNDDCKAVSIFREMKERNRLLEEQAEDEDDNGGGIA